MEKLDLRKTAKNNILLSSGGLMRDLSAEIQDEDYPMRREKILDHLVFCGNLQAHTPFILTNELSLPPRAKKISDNFGKLEAMIMASITEIERMKVLAEESNAD